MGRLATSVSVQIGGGFTARISDCGDLREIVIEREPGAELYRELSLAPLADCVKRFASP